MPLIRHIFSIFCLTILGCGLINDVNNTEYVDIQAQVMGINIEGYDGYIKTDWLITNISEKILNGWEIEVAVQTPNQHIPKGIFFKHDILLEPDSSALFQDLVLFFQNPESLYPVVLTSGDTTLALNGWQIISTKGVILP